MLRKKIKDFPKCIYYKTASQSISNWTSRWFTKGTHEAITCILLNRFFFNMRRWEEVQKVILVQIISVLLYLNECHSVFVDKHVVGRGGQRLFLQEQTVTRVNTIRFIQVWNLTRNPDCRASLAARRDSEYLKKLLIIFLRMVPSFF